MRKEKSARENPARRARDNADVSRSFFCPVKRALALGARRSALGVFTFSVQFPLLRFAMVLLTAINRIARSRRGDSRGSERA